MPIEVIAEVVAGAVAEGATVVADVTANVVADAAVELGLRTVEAVADVAINTAKPGEETTPPSTNLEPEPTDLKLMIAAFLGLFVVTAIIFGAIIFTMR